MTVSTRLEADFHAALQTPDFFDAVQTLARYDVKWSVREAGFFESIGPQSNDAWATTSFLGRSPSLETVLYLDNIAKGGVGVPRGTKWALKHSLAEFIAHEVGHAEGAAILTRGLRKNVPASEVGRDALLKKTDLNAKGHGQAFRSSLGLKGTDHNEAQGHSGDPAPRDVRLQELEKKAPAPSE